MAPAAPPRKSGIYALLRFDGGPVDAAAAAALGFPHPREPAPYRIEAVDVHASAALHRHEDGDLVTVIAGDLEEPAELAARLGLDRSTPPAHLAKAALERFGAAAAIAMVGEWSLLQWDRRGVLTLMMSAARRDPVLYAISGPHLAVAPDLYALGRVAWIGSRIDERGLLCGLGRGPLRAILGERTMYAAVRQLEPGSRVVVSADGKVRKDAAAALPEQPRWRGTFDDAVSETEQLMRRIMRDRLGRTAKPAVLLSGGLDSSLLAWLSVQERGSDQALLAMTSVAPPGSGIADEAQFAEAVADRLAIPIRHVVPAAELDSYRPSDAILSGYCGPPLANRHCLTEAFQCAAREADATLLINGTYGELTATARLHELMPRHRLRRMAASLMRRLRGAASANPRGPFHVRLAPHRLGALPEPLREAIAAQHGDEAGWPPGELLGYHPGAYKSLRHANEFYPGALRMDFPYRDLRLLRLFAGFPVAMLLAGHVDRAPAREMLAGRLPDAVRLRRSGLPASPDHHARMQRQAAAARDRIAAFRKAGADDWLDIGWLDTALARIAVRGVSGVSEANEVQLTAIAAEFLTWWRERC